LPTSAKFGRRPFPHLSVILFTERQNDHITFALLAEATNYECKCEREQSFHTHVQVNLLGLFSFYAESHSFNKYRKLLLFLRARSELHRLSFFPYFGHNFIGLRQKNWHTSWLYFSALYCSTRVGLRYVTYVVRSCRA